MAEIVSSIELPRIPRHTDIERLLAKAKRACESGRLEQARNLRGQAVTGLRAIEWVRNTWREPGQHPTFSLREGAHAVPRDKVYAALGIRLPLREIRKAQKKLEEDGREKIKKHEEEIKKTQKDYEAAGLSDAARNEEIRTIEKNIREDREELDKKKREIRNKELGRFYGSRGLGGRFEELLERAVEVDAVAFPSYYGNLIAAFQRAEEDYGKGFQAGAGPHAKALQERDRWVKLYETIRQGVKGKRTPAFREALLELGYHLDANPISAEKNEIFNRKPVDNDAFLAAITRHTEALENAARATEGVAAKSSRQSEKSLSASYRKIISLLERAQRGYRDEKTQEDALEAHSNALQLNAAWRQEVGQYLKAARSVFGRKAAKTLLEKIRKAEAEKSSHLSATEEIKQRHYPMEKVWMKEARAAVPGFEARRDETQELFLRGKRKQGGKTLGDIQKKLEAAGVRGDAIDYVLGETRAIAGIGGDRKLSRLLSKLHKVKDQNLSNITVLCKGSLQFLFSGRIEKARQQLENAETHFDELPKEKEKEVREKEMVGKLLEHVKAIILAKAEAK